MSLERDINLVEPGDLEVFSAGQHVAIRRKKDGTVTSGLKVSLMFPLTERSSYIQFTDSEDNEVGILRTTNGLDESSKRVIEFELDKYYFIPTIVKIDSIEPRFSSDVWNVLTEKGPRTFEVVGKRRNIQSIASDHIVIKDIDGNRYEIRCVSKLDKFSQKLLDQEV